MALFGKKKRNAQADWIAFDQGPHDLAWASVSPSKAPGGKPRVNRWQTLGLDALANRDESALAELRMAGSALRRSLVLGREDYKIMVVPEPPVPEPEIEQSLRWTLGTMLDFPVSEASIDWLPIPTRKELPNRPPHIYVIAARRSAVLERAEPFAQNKLALQAIDVRETAQRNIAARIAAPDEGLGLISVNAQGILLTLCWNGELYLDRFIPEPLQTMLSGDAAHIEAALERIVLQVQRSIDSLGRLIPFISIDRMVVGPLPAPIPLQQHLEAGLSIPVENLDLASVFDLSVAGELVEAQAQARAFVALGAALREIQGDA